MAQRKTSTVKKTAAKAAPAVEEEKTEMEAPIVVSEEAAREKAATPTEEPMVRLLYLDSAIANNEIPIGGGRVISGSGRRFSVKLSDFEGTFLTPLVMKLLKKRKFIVLSGLNEEQREQYGVDYKKGEVLLNETMFEYFFTAPVAEAKETYRELCREHRELVEARFLEAFEKGDNRLTRERVEALNEISKQDYEDKRGAFTPILEEINKRYL